MYGVVVLCASVWYYSACVGIYPSVLYMSSVIHVLEVLSAGYNRAYLYFSLVDHTMSSITGSALNPALIEFVYCVDIFSTKKI